LSIEKLERVFGRGGKGTLVGTLVGLSRQPWSTKGKRLRSLETMILRRAEKYQDHLRGEDSVPSGKGKEGTVFPFPIGKDRLRREERNGESPHRDTVRILTESGVCFCIRGGITHTRGGEE